MEKTEIHKIPQEKFYKERQIWVGSMTGGPLAAGYLIRRNFRECGLSKEATITTILAPLITVIVFWLAFVLPDGFPNFVLPMIYTVGAFIIFKTFQADIVAVHIENGGLIESWWKTIGISALSLVITITPIIALIYVTLPIEESKMYGQTQNEITFQKGNISEEEIDKIAKIARATEYFGDDRTGYLYVVKSGATYVISINYISVEDIDLNEVAGFRQVRKDFQTHFLDHKIVINLIVNDLDNVIKRIE